MSDFQGIMKSSLTEKLIPLDFVPYLEKHKLYEFFYELVTQLLIQQPEDPIVFMKQCVQHAVRKRDIPRVILIAPPNFDKITFAKILQDKIGIRLVTLDDLHALTSTKNTCLCYDANEVAKRMKKILMMGVLHDSGWILVDIPRNKKEARALQRVGVIPTHVIQIITSNENESQKKLTTPDSLSRKSYSFTEDMRQLDYKRTLRGLREAYINLLIEIEAGSRTIQELGKDCAALTKIPKHYGAPSLFRIVLIGPPGSGYHSLAKDISERFNLIYVNFNYILRQACLQETALGEMLQLCEHRCGQQLKPEIKIEIIKQFVLKSECLKTGWILIGYPKTVKDFKLLDMIPTPPNRVIILKMDAQTCRERLLNCRHSANTKSEHDFASTDSFKIDPDCELNFYPENHRNIIKQNLREYKENIKSILQYAGDTASIIDAMGERKLVKERLEAYLMRPAFTKIRIPEPLSMIEPMNIEFDPNDEPDSSIFENIRVAEFKYSFV